MVTGQFVAHVDRPRIDGWYVGFTEATWGESEIIVTIHWDKEGALQREEILTLKWGKGP